MTERKEEFITVPVTPAMKAQFGVFCRERGVGASTVVRMLIAECLQGNISLLGDSYTEVSGDGEVNLGGHNVRQQ